MVSPSAVLVEGALLLLGCNQLPLRTYYREGWGAKKTERAVIWGRGIDSTTRYDARV